MQSPISMTIIIEGDFSANTFLDWIISRANQLNLTGWVRSSGNNLIEILVTGNPILIDALEVVCSLGPIDVQVDRISKEPAKTSDTAARQSDQFVRYLPHK